MKHIIQLLANNFSSHTYKNMIHDMDHQQLNNKYYECSHNIREIFFENLTFFAILFWIMFIIFANYWLTLSIISRRLSITIIT